MDLKQPNVVPIDNWLIGIFLMWAMDEFSTNNVAGLDGGPMTTPTKIIRLIYHFNIVMAERVAAFSPSSSKLTVSHIVL